jgi:predicted alpha/beta hydrolase
MVFSPDGDVADVAVLDGGPMDGKEHPADWDTEQLCVIMTDGQQQRYVRTERTQVLPDGRSAVVFEYRGRHYGPK